MDVEQQLRETYAERLGALEPSGGDVDVARRTGARLRARRRLAVGAAAVAIVTVAVGGTLVGTGRVSVGPSHDVGHWRELPAAPLSPRAYAESVWTGREVIVLGGSTDPCPPNASCVKADVELRDGAAYDPATNSWHRIASAPVPVGPGDRLLAADGVVVLRHWQQHGSRWFTYEPDHNRWSRIGNVPRGVRDLPSAYGSKVYALVGRRVAVYDVRSFRWTLLPGDSRQPPMTERRITATPDGPVVIGQLAINGPETGDGVTADLYDGRSWRRFPMTHIEGNDWVWAGDRMVDFDSYQHQGMDRMLPGVSLGGTLDPSTGQASPLPDSALETPPDPWSPNAVGPGPWAASWGLVYDVSHGRAWTLPRPDGAQDEGVTAAWAAGELLAFGGTDYGADGAEPVNRAWLYTPPTS
ncbi:hypothetical protein [Nocardioides sp.]|jgi:hypothetical protein|uniref:hypothetical protein n=1 Tax=Nocardioides sp. TaxID=35761 RepID=UPI002F41279B